MRDSVLAVYGAVLASQVRITAPVLCLLLLVLCPRGVQADGSPDLSGVWSLYATWDRAHSHWLHIYDDGSFDQSDGWYPPGPWVPGGWNQMPLVGDFQVEQHGTALSGTSPSPWGQKALTGSVIGSSVTGTITYPRVTEEHAGGDCGQSVKDISVRFTATLEGLRGEGPAQLQQHLEDVTVCPGVLTTIGDEVTTGTMVVVLGTPQLISLEALGDEVPLLGGDGPIWIVGSDAGEPVADTLAAPGFTIRASLHSPSGEATCSYTWTITGTSLSQPSTALPLTQDPGTGLWVGSLDVALPDAIGRYILQLHFDIRSGSLTTTTDTAHELYVSYDEPATDAHLLPSASLPLKKPWLEFATSAAQGSRTAEEAAHAITSFIYQTGWTGAWHYQDPGHRGHGTDWPVLIQDVTANGNCVSFSDLWAAVGRMLGFAQFGCVQRSTPLGFATVAPAVALDHQVGNAVGGEDLTHRWVFGMHQIGVLGDRYYDPTFGRTYQTEDEFIEWRLISQVIPDPLYLGLPHRAFDATGFQRFFEVHQAPPWGAWEYRSLVEAMPVPPGDLALPTAFTGAYAFSPVDANGDSVADALQVTADLDLPSAGDYVVSGTLFVGTTPVSSRSGHDATTLTSTSFESSGPGVVPTALLFSGQEIRDCGLEGPYTAVLHLMSASGGVLAVGSCDSASYSHLAFGETNSPPTMVPVEDMALPELWPISIQVQVHDPESNPLQLSIDLLPDGATFDPHSGLFEWTPRRGQAGEYRVTFTASDGVDSTSHVVMIVVTEHSTFWDVAPEHWAFRHIEACHGASIVAGYPDGSYGPAVQVTRDQMAVYIARALADGDANVPTGPETPSFADVPPDHWAYKYVEYAAANHVVVGYWDGYHPAEAVDRGQMAVYVARSIVDPTGEGGLVGYTPPATPTFPDVPTDYWAYGHIEYCKEQGIVSGYWDGYHPEQTVTRDQMAVYVARAFQLRT